MLPLGNKNKEKKGKVYIGKNDENGCEIIFSEKNSFSVEVKDKDYYYFRNAIYIEDPYILDRVDNYNPLIFGRYRSQNYNHLDNLMKLLSKNKINTIIEQSVNQDVNDIILKKVNSIIPGSLISKNGILYYEGPNKQYLRVQNLATGSKMFSIIKNLIEKGEIDVNTLLILDEPESHLHPSWQNIFAEMIVLLVKELGVRILLATHSSNFLMALEGYSKKYDIEDKTNYYVPRTNKEELQVEYENVNGRTSVLYHSFAKPLIEAKKIKDEQIYDRN